MQRFSSGKRILYIAAHPDDENTRLIAWFSNALNAETTYLSLTKGSGGQNLIGDELGTDLGVIGSKNSGPHVALMAVINVSRMPWIWVFQKR